MKQVLTFGVPVEQEFRLNFLICQNNFPLFAIELNGIQHYKILNKHLGELKVQDREESEIGINDNIVGKWDCPL